MSQERKNESAMYGCNICKRTIALPSGVRATICTCGGFLTKLNLCPICRKDISPHRLTTVKGNEVCHLICFLNEQSQISEKLSEGRFRSVEARFTKENRG